jgi:EAL domain-containing protein (putative c-di-GMP-specific phosphodiesterase class I)
MFLSALENDRICIYLQPKFSIEDQKLIGAEALSRIIDEEGNVIPPGMYIDTLEKSGLICRLDNYVVDKVIELQKSWKAEGKELISISMNLSKSDFWEPDFIENLDKSIETVIAIGDRTIWTFDDSSEINTGFAEQHEVLEIVANDKKTLVCKIHYNWFE